MAHVGYRGLGGFASQRITNNAFYTLNYRLFDPLLPWTLIDLRRGDREARTMRGIPVQGYVDFPKSSGIGSLRKRGTAGQMLLRCGTTTEYRHQTLLLVLKLRRLSGGFCRTSRFRRVADAAITWADCGHTRTRTGVIVEGQLQLHAVDRHTQR